MCVVCCLAFQFNQILVFLSGVSESELAQEEDDKPSKSLAFNMIFPDIHLFFSDLNTLSLQHLAQSPKPSEAFSSSLPESEPRKNEEPHLLH